MSLSPENKALVERQWGSGACDGPQQTYIISAHDLGALMDRAREEGRAQGQTEEGWRLVPVEPTPEMLVEVAPQTGDASANDYRTAAIALFELGDGPAAHGVSRKTLLAELARDYRAMLAAAPHPPKVSASCEGGEDGAV